MRRRWDIDERGHGITDAQWLTADAQALLAAMTAPDWVAEDPDAHLLPHVRRAIDASGGAWTLDAWRDDDGVLVLETTWRGVGRREVRAAAFALLGEIAEAATLVRQRAESAGEAATFEMVTGMVEGDGAFAPHGHTVRLIVRR